MQLIAGEASNRRYYRIRSTNGKAFIIMDADPWLEDNLAFVTVAGILASAMIRVPTIYEWDEPNGFLLLEDMGNQTLLQLNLRTHSEAVRHYYHKAIDTLTDIQLNACTDQIANFSSDIMRNELNLFSDWYLDRHLKIKLTDSQQHEIAICFDLITEKNQSIDRVFVHRDFRPGNLIISKNFRKIAVLDFQDAIKGPITYDLVSLLWDSFHCWNEQFIQKIIRYYWVTANGKGLPVPSTLPALYSSLYWTRLQRHVRVIGIFARLGIRDGKYRYFQEIERFNKYILSNTVLDDGVRPLIYLLKRINQSLTTN
ncbi:aminoglycoside phosphotransferase family protein [Pseudomonas asplenii]|uniref:aminoglycoside phosphotransferase family protein n=1 Tax=Pseudomonas asplenii TaxID=53407 RepID=UPI00156154B2|nr:phosphotransferase [Pseudomonas asplenii]